MREKIALIGAGSAMFMRGLIRDMICRRWECDLALVDVSPEALKVSERLAAKMIQARLARIALSASTDRRDALGGATAVICTIGVGGRRAWEQDVYIPRKYGIYQPVGDSVMPGGTSRALRMIPAMVEIARDVMELCPTALFFNYGNPMACVCRGVRKATGADVVGLCHGVHQVGNYLADVLGADRGAIRYSAAGMNHLTWFTDVRVGGQDAMPRLRQIAAFRRGTGADNPFSWQLFELLGAFPAVLDRHVIEFFCHLFRGGSYCGKTLGVDVFSVEETIAHGDRIYEEMRRLALSAETLPQDYFEQIGGEHEQVVEIVECIRNDIPRVYSANVPNRGQVVPNFPGEAVVECPALTTGSGLVPLAQKPLSPAIAGTLATRFQWVETVVDAAIGGSREKFIAALILDGAVESIEQAAALADELLAAQAEYLPQFRSQQAP